MTTENQANTHQLIDSDVIASKETEKEPGMALVAVVIPFYNQLDKLEHTLDSLIAQEQRPSLVILVDDKGDERIHPESLSRLHTAGIHTVLVENSRNLGPGGSRQAGFREVPSDTDYVVFLDSDDRLSERYISSSISMHKKRPDVIATYSDSLNTATGESRVQSSPPPTNLLDGIVSRRSWGTGALMWKYRLIRNTEWMPFRVYEDSHFELSAAILNPAIAFVPEAVLHIDQNFLTERLVARNRKLPIELYREMRMRLFERMVFEYPYSELGPSASKYNDLAVYKLCKHFNKGPLAYLNTVLRLLSAGRLRSSALMAYWFPLYLSKRKQS